MLADHDVSSRSRSRNRERAETESGAVVASPRGHIPPGNPAGTLNGPPEPDCVRGLLDAVIVASNTLEVRAGKLDTAANCMTNNTELLANMKDDSATVSALAGGVNYFPSVSQLTKLPKPLMPKTCPGIGSRESS